jgi:hypothetical protein
MMVFTPLATATLTKMRILKMKNIGTDDIEEKPWNVQKSRKINWLDKKPLWLSPVHKTPATQIEQKEK